MLLLRSAKQTFFLQRSPSLLQSLVPKCHFSRIPTRKPRKGKSEEKPTKIEAAEDTAEVEEQDAAEVEELSALVSCLVLTHTGGDAQALSQTLLSHPSRPTFSPALVDRVIKLLWNDGPKALLFLHSLLDHHPSYRPAASTLDYAIDIAARLRDRNAVGCLLSLRQKLRVPPTPRTFAIIMERYASTGKPDRAVRLFLSMHKQGCLQDLSSFNTLLDVLCKTGRAEKACSLFKTFQYRFKPDTITYNIIADGWCRIKRTPRAVETLKEMVELGLEPTLTTYNILLKGFFRAGQVNEALQFFREMKKRGREEGTGGFAPDVVSYTTVVHGLGVAGQVKRARKVFDEMISNGCLPSVVTYNALIQVICKKDCVKNAILVFDGMVRKGYTPNPVTYNLVIRGLCHASDLDRAMEFLGQMKNEGCKPNVQTYNVLIRYWSEAGEIEKGLDLFKEMGEGGNCLPDMDSYNVLLSAMFVRKRPEDMLTAGKLVVEMVERGHIPRRFMFNRVLNGLLLTGNQAFARELLRIHSTCRRLPREVKL